MPWKEMHTLVRFQGVGVAGASSYVIAGLFAHQFGHLQRFCWISALIAVVIALLVMPNKLPVLSGEMDERRDRARLPLALDRCD